MAIAMACLQKAFIGNINMTESMSLSTVFSKLFIIYHKLTYYRTT